MLVRKHQTDERNNISKQASAHTLYPDTKRTLWKSVTVLLGFNYYLHANTTTLIDSTINLNERQVVVSFQYTKYGELHWIFFGDSDWRTEHKPDFRRTKCFVWNCEGLPLVLVSVRIRLVLNLVSVKFSGTCVKNNTPIIASNRMRSTDFSVPTVPDEWVPVALLCFKNRVHLFK